MVAKFSPDRWPPAAGVRQLVGPGNVVVDAGANVGYITALLAQWVGVDGRVHSFEPVPITSDLLRRSVAHLKLGQVAVHPCGVSDRAGGAKMSIPRYADGGENLYESRVIDEGEMPPAWKPFRSRCAVWMMSLPRMFLASRL
ncbi:MAG: FkbM family methyltransferase [Kiritimatiellae bacterium]|nr:FkbM family methyltransferase [Kiritimatiellia bacterium]